MLCEHTGRCIVLGTKAEGYLCFPSTALFPVYACHRVTIMLLVVVWKTKQSIAAASFDTSQAIVLEYSCCIVNNDKAFVSFKQCFTL